LKIKKTKDQRIVDLERKLMEALAGQSHVYHFADAALGKANSRHLTASGVVITMTVLGGHELFPPVLMRDGLSDELIEALRVDFRRCYALATLYKPKDPK
jgi:hypothetical protein